MRNMKEILQELATTMIESIRETLALNKAPRFSISNDIWILSYDTICQTNQLFSNSEAAMLST